MQDMDKYGVNNFRSCQQSQGIYQLSATLIIVSVPQPCTQPPIYSCPFGGVEFAGPENDGPKKIKDWKMQDLENNGPNSRAGKCRTWKMTDRIAGR